jgi:hypothetical protein|tara:strand:- start:12291 stop:13208 length:918 start_codon:yes stop_codon:yes gene_type:complete
MTNDIDIYRGGRALQLKDITSELEDFAMSTHMWEGFFKADGNLGMHNVFCSEYLDWIQSNKRNDILGIDHFHHISMTAGTSEAFQMFMMRHNNRKFKFFKGDFMMHKVASNVMVNDWSWIYDAGEVTADSAVIISCPFSDFGAEHPQMEELLNICDMWKVPVLIDMAYFGMCHDIEIDLSHKCIEEVTFSLGKTFPIIGARAGIRLQKNEVDDAVTFANQHGIVNNFGALFGLTCIESWDSDYIVRECKDIQLQVCDSLNVNPSKCIIFATSDNEEWSELNRGNTTSRLCISQDIEQQYDKQDNQ